MGKPRITKETETHSVPLEFSKDRRRPTHHNDVRWYGNDPQLIKDSASIPFAEPLGPQVKYGPNARSIPGICVMHYVPTVGPIGTVAPGQAPINLAAVRYFSEIRKANSGARNYDPNDLIQIMLGVAGVYEALAFCKRLYSLLRDYQQTNRYYSKRIIEAMNVDFDDLLANIASFRYFINVSITRTEVFGIPNNMSFLLRRIWMAESIFLDAPMRKGQTYIFCPIGVQYYDWNNAEVQIQPWSDDSGNTYSTHYGQADWADGSLITFAAIKHTIESMLASLALNTDVGIITGDLLKAYGSAGLFRMAPIPEDYHVEPLYNVEVLQQIHNLTTAMDTTTYKSYTSTEINTFDLSQNGAILNYKHANGNPTVEGKILLSKYCDPKVTGVLGQVDESHFLLDSVKDPVSPEDVMVATRLVTIRKSGTLHYDAGTTDYELVNFGSEVVLGCQLWSLVDHTSWNTWVVNSSTLSIADLIKYVVPFSFLPRGFVFTKQDNVPNTGDKIWEFDDIELGTIDNYTIVDTSTLFKMHQTAVLSEFYVSSMPASNGRK